ncbi:hypothetical protein [uncultured Desulfovibrio sp.]|nr:hypothetical protein [uncultured Desulfovibrio sp.]
MARDGALELWPSIMQAARDGNMEAVKLVLATVPCRWRITPYYG